MITHSLNFRDYNVGEELKTFGGDRVVSDIGRDDNGGPTFLEVAQLFEGSSIIDVGRYIPIKMLKGEQRFHTNRIIKGGDPDYQRYRELYLNRRKVA